MKSLPGLRSRMPRKPRPRRIAARPVLFEDEAGAENSERQDAPPPRTIYSSTLPPRAFERGDL